MKYTPYDNHSVAELILEVLNKPEPTDLELALMERLEMLQDEIEELHEIRQRDRVIEIDVEGAPV